MRLQSYKFKNKIQTKWRDADSKYFKHVLNIVFKNTNVWKKAQVL